MKHSLPPGSLAYFAAKRDLGRSLVLAMLIVMFCLGCGETETPVPTPPAFAPPETDTPCPALLHVDTEPSGAKIRVDGLERGVAPLSLALEPGEHRLEAAEAGLETASVALTLPCGTTSKTLQLADVLPPTLTVDKARAQVASGDGLKVAARAEDPSGIGRMAFLLDGELVQETAEASLRVNLDTRPLASGAHTVIVVARDGAGNEAKQQFAFEIVEAVSTTVPDQATPTTVLQVYPTLPAAPTPEPSPVAVRQMASPVQVVWDEITIPTYRYEQALYVDDQAGLPYPKLHEDRVGSPEPRTYRVLIMRNAYLELTLLPELGGRIYQCRFLPTGQTLFYNNQVIKPTHWGPEDQGWWLAVGGLEFCLPVDEHGYLTAQPWELGVEQLEDGSAIATVSVSERTRSISAQVEIGLRPDQSRFTLVSSLTNTSESTQSLQYWINGMLAPGAPSIGPALRWYVPTDEVIVHSTGDQSLPDAGQRMAWPVYDGREIGSYESWRSWLGVFATDLRAPYSAVYDHDAQVGMVRVFPAQIARGVKLFAFGLGFGDTRSFTDDGSQYVEMWGGWTPTFWDDGTLAPHETLTWQEAWYPVTHMAGITMATENVALAATRQGDQVICDVSANEPGRWFCQLLAQNQVVLQQPLTMTPDRTEQLALAIPAGNQQALLAVRIVDNNEHLLLEQSLPR